MAIKLENKMHIIGLLVDIAGITTLTSSKKAFIAKTITEFGIDTKGELFEACTVKFHGMQPHYLRNYCTVEEREAALSYVNEMIASDPNCPINFMGEMILGGLKEGLGL